MNRIGDEYRRADLSERLNLFLQFRDFRREFIEIEKADYERKSSPRDRLRYGEIGWKHRTEDEACAVEGTDFSSAMTAVARKNSRRWRWLRFLKKWGSANREKRLDL